MILAGSLKVGMILKINNQYWKVFKVQIVKPGKGGAFASTVLKNILNQQQKEITFRNEEKLEDINIFDVDATCIQKSNEESVFILNNADMINVNNKQIENVSFLEESMQVTIQFTEDNVLLNVSLPHILTCQIESTQSFLKGQTESPSLKPAILKNGETIKVPTFINNGEIIQIKIVDGAPVFYARVKN